MLAPRVIATFPITDGGREPSSTIRITETVADTFAVMEYRRDGSTSHGMSGLSAGKAFTLAFEWGGWNLTAVQRYWGDYEGAEPVSEQRLKPCSNCGGDPLTAPPCT